MPNTSANSHNLAYQDAPSLEGGSYTANKLQKLNLPSLRGLRFLDLGCNTGFYCDFAQTQGARRAVGVDIDSTVIKQAREAYPAVEFFDTGWDALPDGEFDVIIFLSAIHYARDPIALVNNIKSHLASDGILILEGGLIDVEGKFKTDLLIPGWRSVGDRCRHLSRGFVDEHLLREFKWKIIGSSEPRGGDNVPRHVIHASPARAFEEKDCYQVDLMEYAQGLALSAETIVPGMPSYSYVRQLGPCSNITPEALVSVLSNESHFAAFMDDLLFAIGDRRPMTLTVDSRISDALLGQVANALNNAHVRVILI